MTQNARTERRVPTLPLIDGKQEIAIVSLLAGAKDAEAADKAGVRRETVHRWRNSDPHFVAELARRRRELWEVQEENLVRLLASAITALADGLAPKSPPNVRLRAAEIVLRTLKFESGEPASNTVTPEGVERSWRIAEYVATSNRAGVDALMSGG
ncbi:MAG: hypothetical protein U0174_25990 [Polyangiaceae bacterium]